MVEFIKNALSPAREVKVAILDEKKNELMNLKGMYYELFTSQALDEKTKQALK